MLSISIKQIIEETSAPEIKDVEKYILATVDDRHASLKKRIEQDLVEAKEEKEESDESDAPTKLYSIDIQSSEILSLEDISSYNFSRDFRSRNELIMFLKSAYTAIDYIKFSNYLDTLPEFTEANMTKLATKLGISLDQLYDHESTVLKLLEDLHIFGFRSRTKHVGEITEINVTYGDSKYYATLFPMVRDIFLPLSKFYLGRSIKNLKIYIISDVVDVEIHAKTIMPMSDKVSIVKSDKLVTLTFNDKLWITMGKNTCQNLLNSITLVSDKPIALPIKYMYSFDYVEIINSPPELVAFASTENIHKTGNFWMYQDKKSNEFEFSVPRKYVCRF